MTIVRVNKRPDRYTRIPNEIVQDNGLDMDALGLLTYLLSKPDNWKVRANDIQKRFSTGKHKPYTALKKLQDAGYATWSRRPDGTVIWQVFDDPDPEKRDKAEKPHPEKPDQENRDVVVKTERAVTTDSLSTRKPKRATQFPHTEIPEHWIRVCNEKRPDLDPYKLFEIMKSWCEANEKTYKDWDAAWRNWLMKEQKHAKPNGSRKESRDERLAREQREYADTAEGRAALAALERSGLGL